MKLHLNPVVSALFVTVCGFVWLVLAASHPSPETMLKSILAIPSAENVGGDCCRADISNETLGFQEKCACGLCACSAECHGEGCNCSKPCSCKKCGCPRDNDSNTSAGGDRILWAGSDGPMSRTGRR